MEENAGNVFFCNQIIYENTYEKKVSCCFIDLYLLSYWLGKKVSCCFIDLYLLSYWLGSTRFCLEIGAENEGGV